MEKKYKEFCYDSPFHGTNAPQATIIDSGLYSKNLRSHMLILKSHPVSWMPFFEHWFLAYRNFEWHPGAPNEEIYTERACGHENLKKGTRVRHVYECCKSCADFFLEQSIKQDRRFSLIGRNCDIILGNGTETLLFYLGSLAIFVSLFFELWLISILAIAALFAMYLDHKFVRQNITYSACDHILIN